MDILEIINRETIKDLTLIIIIKIYNKATIWLENEQFITDYYFIIKHF